MTTPSLAIIPLERIRLQTTRDELPDGVRLQMDEATTHRLRMAKAVERVILEIPVPEPLEGTMQLLEQLLGAAIMARVAADAMAAPAIQRRRPTHPGAVFGGAEQAAQMAYQAFRVELGQSWPVKQWTETLRAIAIAASEEGAWELLAIVGDGLEGDAGSVEWWDAVVHVTGLWGP
ncbi:MAG TPA: hypothetical protein VLZ09_00480, partial [Gaiellaceae bacterium]|nr:hypothetical protein [Gaiellaceae bacterium]